jgi:Transposase IS116/IS110/IS902 family
VGLAACWDRPDRGDGADPQRLGAAGRLVPPPRRRGHPGPPGNSQLTCGSTTPSTPSPIIWIPGCWPGCRCCTLRDCGPPRAWARRTGCAGPRNCGPAWSKRRSTILARLDAYLELLGPAWHAALGGDLALNTPLRFLAAGYAHPHTLRRLGRARLTRFIWRYSHGAWGPDHATRLLDAATQTLALWEEDIDYTELAEDIAVEARLALQLTTEIRDLEQKIAALLHDRDPAGIMTSVPGAGAINAAQILARLGDPARFRSLAGARSFTGLIPSLTASGTSGHHGPPTKAGDAPLREALFMAADAARRTDPTLAARYHRLMVHQGKHHNSALCHISTVLLTRIVACWRAGTPYQLRDTDGTPITPSQGRQIIHQRYQISAELRAQRRTSHIKTPRRTGEERSRQALRHQPANTHATIRQPA